MGTLNPRIIERDMTKEMCRRVDLPWTLGRAILIMARTSLGTPHDDTTDMAVVARAIKYTSDNRHNLKRPVRTYQAKQNPFLSN